jgi:hypothetical protein
MRRIADAARALAPEQRLAGILALALLGTMLLPWYTRSAVGVVDGRPVSSDSTLVAFQVFSFVEAAILLVAVGVLALLFARGEGRAFHLPGGDGTVILGAGVWVCLLVFWRQFDQPEPDAQQGLAVSTGVTWGIFVTFLVGAGLALAGWRLREAHLREPPLPGEGPAGPPPTSVQQTRVQETRVSPPDAGQH